MHVKQLAWPWEVLLQLACVLGSKQSAPTRLGGCSAHDDECNSHAVIPLCRRIIWENTENLKHFSLPLGDQVTRDQVTCGAHVCFHRSSS